MKNLYLIEKINKMIKTHQIIKYRREQIGLSQEYIAAELGITQPTYALIESGKSKLSLERAIQLSKLLEIDLKELAGIENSEISIKNNSFNDSSSAIQNYNLQNKILFDEIISTYKEEIVFLRNQISELIKSKQF